jgi:hypothetical protein
LPSDFPIVQPIKLSKSGKDEEVPVLSPVRNIKSGWTIGAKLSPKKVLNTPSPLDYDPKPATFDKYLIPPI